MGIPVMYQGSLHLGGIVRPIPPDVTPPSGGPQFSSAEIGTFNASTVVVTFDQNVLAAENDYASGVTIKVNGVSTSISGGIRQTNHAVVYYGIPVLWHGSGDTVTWEYNSAVGIIVAESGGAALGNVTAQSVTNNCEYLSLLDLQVDTLALNNSDPVSTWADQSGQGHDFTQTGTARPTYLANYNGYPAVYFPSGPPNYDAIYMDGGTGEYADNLLSFAVFHIAEVTDENGDIVIAKQAPFVDTNARGWQASFFGAFPTAAMIIEVDTILVDSYQIASDINQMSVVCSEMLSRSEGHTYINGQIVNESNPKVGTVITFSNNSHIYLAANDDAISSGATSEGWIRTVMLYSPIPNATNRAALETRLGARYGLVVP